MSRGLSVFASSGSVCFMVFFTCKQCADRMSDWVEPMRGSTKSFCVLLHHGRGVARYAQNVYVLSACAILESMQA